MHAPFLLNPSTTKLNGIIHRNCKFVCLFIAKIWWMMPRVGKSASEIPLETQMLLMEVGEESVFDVVDDETLEEPATGNKFYILVLPVLDGAFRTTLQGTPSNELQFCYESGLFPNLYSLSLRMLFY